MKKVTVMMTNGVIKSMDARYARALVLCKKAIYLNNYEQKVVPNGSYSKKSEVEQDVTPPVLPEEVVVEEEVTTPEEEVTTPEEEVVSEEEVVTAELVLPVEEEVVFEENTENDDDLTALRKEYSDKFDKKCYHGWSAEEIKAKILAG